VKKLPAKGKKMFNKISFSYFILFTLYFFLLPFTLSDPPIRGQTNQIRQDRRMIGAAGRPYLISNLCP